MTINKDDYYLKNIELLRKLQPIMEKKGIRYDDCLPIFSDVTSIVRTVKEWLPTWRKDSLEAALPEWCWYYKTEGFGYVDPNNNLFVGNKETPRLRDVVRDRMEKRIGTRVNLKPNINGITQYFRGCENKWDAFIVNKEFIEDLIVTILNLQEIWLLGRGQESLEALAQLVILLDEEGVE